MHNKRGIFILRCKVFNFRSFVRRDIFLIRADDCAFKFVTCSYAYGVNDIVTYTVGIGAVGHCNEQVVGLDKLDFVDCEAVVKRNGNYCAELSA